MLFALIDISPFENINRLFETTNKTLLQATVICYPAYLNWFEVKSIKEYFNEHQRSYLSDMYTAWANRSIHYLCCLSFRATGRLESIPADPRGQVVSLSRHWHMETNNHSHPRTPLMSSDLIGAHVGSWNWSTWRKPTEGWEDPGGRCVRHHC